MKQLRLWKESPTKKLRKEMPFLMGIALASIIISLIYQESAIAMWTGFALAGYSSIANDSIQTLGPFLSSNRKVPWWALWIFIGGIMVITHTTGWFIDDGDMAFGRLQRIPEVTNFSYLQILTPIILIFLTQYRMPVSTTFLLLSVFSNTKTIEGMLTKTFIGYALAFVVALIFWGIIVHFKRRRGITSLLPREPHRLRWRILQWFATGLLWISWLMQDTANIAVFLPRVLSTSQIIGAMGFLFVLVGILMYLRGGRIQEIVMEKTDIVDVRPATLIAFVFAILLIVFKYWNNLPMSTTWVFLGLLAGRELALSGLSGKKEPYRTSAFLVMKDIGRATIGLIVSLLLALIANDKLWEFTQGIVQTVHAGI